MNFTARKAPALAVLLSCAVLLGGCQPRTDEPTPGAPAAEGAWPAYDYRAAAARSDAVYTLDPAKSRVDILVGKAGPLARFGHEHVVMASGVEGYLALDKNADPVQADLRFALAGLVVDDPAARQRHGLDPDLDADAVAGTRANLLETVLDPARWPFCTLTVTDFDRQGTEYSARLRINLNGHLHETTAPFALHGEAGIMVAEGRLTLLHSELGLEPYSALGGGLRVADPMTIEFRLQGFLAP